MYAILFFYFFFFQAEDGIRDATVTGVQTCALPISRRSAGAPRALPGTATALSWGSSAASWLCSGTTGSTPGCPPSWRTTPPRHDDRRAVQPRPRLVAGLPPPRRRPGTHRPARLIRQVLRMVPPVPVPGATDGLHPRREVSLAAGNALVS